MKVIEVEWEDSMLHPQSWRSKGDLRRTASKRERKHRAVGYIALESATSLTLCATRHEDSRAFAACLTIPASAILKRRTLR